MILEAILSLIKVLIKFIFTLLPNLPNVPSSIVNTVSEYIKLICDNSTFLSFFIDVSYVKIIIEILIVLFGFRESYKFIMWIYHKLPFGSD